MERARDEYLHRLNVASFTRQLRDAPDGQRRKILMDLLAEETARGRSRGWLPMLG
jgi:hypothetical protein